MRVSDLGSQRSLRNAAHITQCEQEGAGPASGRKPDTAPWDGVTGITAVCLSARRTQRQLGELVSGAAGGGIPRGDAVGFRPEHQGRQGEEGQLWERMGSHADTPPVSPTWTVVLEPSGCSGPLGQANEAVTAWPSACTSFFLPRSVLSGVLAIPDTCKHQADSGCAIWVGESNEPHSAVFSLEVTFDPWLVESTDNQPMDAGG